MTARAERIPDPLNGTRVRWGYVPVSHTHGPLESATVETEIGEAASDNFGSADGPQILWFPSLSHARAFCRRIERELPEVTTELLR